MVSYNRDDQVTEKVTVLSHKRTVDTIRDTVRLLTRGSPREQPFFEAFALVWGKSMNPIAEDVSI